MVGLQSVGDVLKEAKEKGESSTKATAKKKRTPEEREARRVARSKIAGKQKELPGMETKRIAKVDTLYEEWRAAVKKRMSFNKLEIAKRDELQDEMRKRNISKYLVEDGKAYVGMKAVEKKLMRVEIKAKKTKKVKEKKPSTSAAELATAE